MGETTEFIRLGLKVIFYFILPGIVIYFRIRKKINTGFAVGVLLLSFVIGVLTSASFQKDPVDLFINQINNNASEAKGSLKILIQYGPEYIEKIDENKIIYKDEFKKLKAELIKEYSSIAQDFYNKYTVKESTDCSEYLTQKNYYGYLLHAMKLINYSESIGGRHEELKNRLSKKIDNSKLIMDSLEEKCD